MKTGLILVIYLDVVLCGTLVKRYSEDSRSDYDSFRNEVTPHIRHREQKKPKDINTRYIDQLFDVNLQYCQRPATCQVLNYTTCMGAKLPYHSTTLELTDLKSQEQVQEKLQLYNYLRFIPKCWAVIQPFLCALYMPKCDKNKVDLPSRVMCKITLEPCKILYNSSVFPEFLNCEDERLFPNSCKNDIHEVKFNTTGFCMDPLVKTDKPEWWYPDVEGCGLKCKDSLYSENEHYQISKFIAVCASICICLNAITIMTFIIDWKTSNKYPASAIFYVNVCFCISYGGWLIQFLGSETRDDIVCKKEGTLRKSEPSATENLSCPVVFVMVYYFMIAGMVWFVIFSYAWYMSSLQALGKIQDRVDRKQAYFHLAAWSLPLILTIITMAISEIDGDYVTGICFVGFENNAARTGLLLVPVVATMLVSGYITVRGLILLIKVKIESREIISEHSSRKIRMNIVRMGVFTLFMIIFCIITFWYHHYIFQNTKLWKDSLQSYILCKLTSFSSDFTHCKQTVRPSVAKLQLQLIAVFGAGIAMASWVWCGAMLHSWGRYIRRKFHCEVEEPMKLQKHKIIAQAFAQRKKFNEGGKISISENHTDPVGLHFELNSAASNDLSITWAANLPRLVNRRGAVPNEVVYSVSSNNISVDSEVSVSLRHVSIESRRNSGDSQVSVQIAELKATRKVNSRRHRSRHKGSRQKSSRHFRSNSRNLGHPSRRLSRTGSKRGSSTSLDSHLQVINALTGRADVKSFQPNLNRRTANAGLDGQNINNFLSNGKLVIPYNRSNFKSESEDENVSLTISESTFNMKLSNHTNNLDLNDELVMKSLCQGVHIEELSSSSDTEESVELKDYGQEKRSRSRQDSRSSKRSKKSKLSRKKISSNSESNLKSDSSSCPEIHQLVQSSLNSATSAGYEKNRGSRQSKTSNDVAVQANAQDIVSQTAAYDLELKNMKKTEDEKHKSKQAKTRENNRYRKASKTFENEGSKKFKKMKEKYKNYGSSEERKSLNRDSDEEDLVKNKYRTSIRKSNEIAAM
ncbi:hypothetical protein JTB14_015703 [Gonioctena quinquepunctata]|nr:hypothetical protein JTB14_015703 [Gonioctena quinquepunctata]